MSGGPCLDAGRAAQAKLLRLDPARLPPAILPALLVAQPMFSVPLKSAGEAGFEPVSWQGLPDEAPRDLFAKLGIKSWRESGSVRLIARAMPLRPVLGHLLAHPTAAQRAVARAWLDSGTPLHLHLYPAVDFSDISEARWLVNAQECRCLSLCRRGASASRVADVLPSMRDLVRRIAAHLPPGSHVLEMACLPDGDIRLVEINPGLSPAEVRALLAS